MNKKYIITYTINASPETTNSTHQLSYFFPNLTFSIIFPPAPGYQQSHIHDIVSVAWALWPRQRVFSVARPESRYSWQHLRCFPWFLKWHTLPETNIAPKNGWLEYYFPIGEAYFQGLRWFQGGYFTLQFHLGCFFLRMTFAIICNGFPHL